MIRQQELMVRGNNSKFLEISFQNTPRPFQPKLHIVKLRNMNQVVDIMKVNESKTILPICPQCCDHSQLQTLPIITGLVCYPPRLQIQKRSVEKKQAIAKQSFTESDQIDGKQSAPIKHKKTYSVQRTKTLNSIEPKHSFRQQAPLRQSTTVIKQQSSILIQQPSQSPTKQYSSISADFTNLIPLTNLLHVIPPDRHTYKAIIVKGNNGFLIRQCLKSRPWWMLVDANTPLEEVNLYWTQLRKQPCYQLLSQPEMQTRLLAPQQKKAVQDKLDYKLNGTSYQVFDKSSSLFTHNHLECNFQVCNKKALFYNMYTYYTSQQQDPFRYIPVTFHIQQGVNDVQYSKFEEYAQQNNVKMWIVKPGEQSNRGIGIEMARNVADVRRMVSNNSTHSNGQQKTFIVQEYITRPLLYNKRKFDIRCYMLITSVNKQIKAYWYSEGYIRTSCKEFSLEESDCKFIHLTNDAVQKKSPLYGKFETGNKISYNEFSKYLSENHNWNFSTTMEQLRNLATDIVAATYQHLDPNHQFNTFELFGLDYMIDLDMRPWLIEVNTNPCLETCCPLLSRLITHLIENTLRIAVDPMYPPPLSRKKGLSDFKNQFELIYSTILDDQVVLPIISQDDDEEEVEDDN